MLINVRYCVQRVNYLPRVRVEMYRFAKRLYILGFVAYQRQSNFTLCVVVLWNYLFTIQVINVLFVHIP